MENNLNLTHNTYITVRCNKCGKLWGFFPMRVIHLQGCDCGNTDHGSPRNWKNGDFGYFTLVKTEEWDLTKIMHEMVEKSSKGVTNP